ncbi:MAG: Rpn family recombination-promoting nuclease/putative transposase, partial [Bdellovibrionaceae bacterium]|nr:Rpn family recombination-promoting nuclease/putative transposase [Pseudobdellovibrionaceae bacterium]
MTKKQTQYKAYQQKIKKHYTLKLTQDIVFKSFFSRNKTLLISLLKSFLPIPDKITDVEILNPDKYEKQNKLILKNQLEIKNPSLYSSALNKKEIVLDLRVKLSTGENINVEMQTISQEFFLKRILFYWAKLYSQDLKKGESYSKINPAYSLIFTSFPLLDKKIKDFTSSFSIRRDKKPHLLFNNDLKIVIVELSKLSKSCDELLDLKEKWCYLLKESGSLTKKDYNYLSQDEEIKMALKQFNKLSKEEELYQKAFSEQIN